MSPDRMPLPDGKNKQNSKLHRCCSFTCGSSCFSYSSFCDADQIRRCHFRRIPTPTSTFCCYCSSWTFSCCCCFDDGHCPFDPDRSRKIHHRSNRDCVSSNSEMPVPGTESVVGRQVPPSRTVDADVPGLRNGNRDGAAEVDFVSANAVCMGEDYASGNDVAGAADFECEIVLGSDFAFVNVVLRVAGCENAIDVWCGRVAGTGTCCDDDLRRFRHHHHLLLLREERSV